MGLINKNHLQIVVDKVKNRLGDFSKLKTQNIIDDIVLKADNSDLNKVKKQVVVGNETSNDETKIRINSNSTTTVLIPTKAELDVVEAKADAAATKANTNQSKLDNFIVTNDDNVTQNTKLAIDADADEIELATVAELNTVKQSVDNASMLVPSETATVGKILKVKSVNADGTFVCEWASEQALPDVPVQDVQINGTTILYDGNANIPIATNTKLGAVKAYGSNAGNNNWAGFGIRVNDSGILYVARATDSDIDSRTSQYNAITPSMQDYAVMKSLTDCKNSALWTDDAKAKSCATLGAVRKRGWTLIDTVEDYDPTKGYSRKYSGQYSDIRIYIYSEAASSNRSIPIRIGYETYQNCAYCSAQIFRQQQAISIASASIDTPECMIEMEVKQGMTVWGNNSIAWATNKTSDTHSPIIVDFLNYIMLSGVSDLPTTGNKLVVYGKEM